MKKTTCILCLLLPLALCFASPRQELAELSDFRLWGPQTLYEKPDSAESSVWHRTFNHEGGLNLRVIKRGKRDEKAGARGSMCCLQAPFMWSRGSF